jgi:Leucine-rich repeat (LRR) protein
LHLRYLGLARTRISEVPEEVGKLQFLQVLDLSGNNGIKELPSSVIKLRRLMRLLIDSSCKRHPDGLGNLTSMEELSEIHCDSLSILEGLGNMRRLRKLAIEFSNLTQELEEAFVVSLGKLSSIQCLQVSCAGHAFKLMDIVGERWAPPRSLREFTTAYSTKLTTLPAWIGRNPSHLTQLSRLEISMENVRQEDLDILERLPVLRCLILWSERQSKLLLVGGAGGFRCLTSFMLGSDLAGQIIFQPGAMPKAEKVVLHISLQVAKEGNGGDSFDLGMDNLPSLQKADVILDDVGVTAGEVERAKAALGAALHAHPNSPTCQIHMKAKPNLAQGIFPSSEDARDDNVSSTGDELGWVYPSSHYYCIDLSAQRQRCKHRVDVANNCCIM